MGKIIRDEFIEFMSTDNRQPEQRMKDRILRRVKDKYIRRYNALVRKTLRSKALEFFVWSRCTRWVYRSLCWWGLIKIDWRELNQFYVLPKRVENFCFWMAERQPQVIKWIDYQEQHCLSSMFYGEDGPFEFNFDQRVSWRDIYVDPKEHQ